MTSGVLYLVKADVLRELAFGAIDQFIAHLRALLEGTESLHLDRREMREHILAAPIRFDEAETLHIVEPFDHANSHRFVLQFPNKKSNNPGKILRIVRNAVKNLARPSQQMP